MTTSLGHLNCQNYDVYLPGYHYLQGLRYAVEEINNSSVLLPDVSLGYEIFDTCFSSIINPTLRFLTANASRRVEVREKVMEYHPRVIAVIGPDSSTAAMTSAEIFSSFLMPQISYYATTDALSDKHYPSFLRTIPPSKYLIEAHLSLLLEFGWTWIAVLGTDDEYGNEGIQSLYEAATTQGICVAYQRAMPLQGEQPAASKRIMTEVIDNIIRNRVNVVVVFSFDIFLSSFLKEVIARNVTGKVWLASEGWAASEVISKLPNIKSVGTVLGTAVGYTKIPGFLEFIKKELLLSQQLNLSVPSRDGSNGSSDDACNQACDQCQLLTPSELLTSLDRRVTFNVYSAVYAVALALHQVLDCASGTCSRLKVYPWQMLDQIKQVNFTILDHPIYFDENGDLPIGFEIVFWDWSEGNVSFKKAGMYHPNLRGLEIDRSLIKWNTQDNMIPKSVCSEECASGHWRKQTGLHPCCFDCMECEAGTFLNKSDLTDCQKCGITQWSPAGSETCHDRRIEVLEWDAAAAILLVIITTVGLALTVAVLVIFMLNFETPVVKSAGGTMCFIMLLQLTISYCSVFSFVGKPTTTSCIVRSVLRTSFVISLSCLMVRSFQIVCIFKMAAKLPKAYDYWVKYNGQYIFVSVCFGIQVLICASEIFVASPRPKPIYEANCPVIIMVCSNFTDAAEILRAAIGIFISFMCLLFVDMGKELPANYNEARCITLVVVLNLISQLSILFIKTLHYGQLLILFEAAANVITFYGLIVGYFFPKCYVILFKPDQNTTAYFQMTIQEYTRRRSNHFH
ncbi:taste receptor type 1 member 2-like [Latimeria chalumnae]|uniref:taste receptor type 1 member 2-like n=1 Tax=Latimeria chalumnae TaxID=7897 RepID=UPI0003C10A78|nr:PREDICTED: taste receptor type 1 member 2-like [Latimeria chalumnae]|eukprot:XP_005986179.1 PREDICTED: taste receptor type 1 member 2-like [Latimeria chalumnae]